MISSKKVRRKLFSSSDFHDDACLMTEVLGEDPDVRSDEANAEQPPEYK